MANKQKMWKSLTAKNIGDPAKGVPPVLSARQRKYHQRYNINGNYPSNLLAQLLDPVIGDTIIKEQAAREKGLISKLAKATGESVDNIKTWLRNRGKTIYAA